MFAFSISVHYLCDAFHIYYLFCKTATMYVRIWSRILSWLDRECVWWWRTMPSNVHSVGLSIRRFAKIIILGENLHFSFNNLFYNIFDDWNKNPCFFVSWYSWMFPNSFILVLLDFVGIAIINYLQSPFLSLSDLCMLLLGRVFLVDVNRVE